VSATADAHTLGQAALEHLSATTRPILSQLHFYCSITYHCDIIMNSAQRLRIGDPLLCHTIPSQLHISTT
jgi:hypothetical protein